LKSGSLNLLEPSGPVQASNGIALVFTNRKLGLAGHYKETVSLNVRRIETDVQSSRTQPNYYTELPRVFIDRRFSSMARDPIVGQDLLFEVSRSLSHTTLGRVPLDE